MSLPPALVDSHCHLDFPELLADLSGVVARARAVGVTRMVTICTRLRTAPDVAAIAAAHEEVYWAAGAHPLHVAEEPMPALGDLLALAGAPKLVGIGETGLDYHYTPATAARQRESFLIHIEAARLTGLPLIVHARAADDEMARILAAEHRAGAFACVMHCFSSGPALAEAALGLGFFLSMSGIAAFPKSDALRAIFRAAPPDRILVETDAPYLAPPPHRGRRNEPAFVLHTARAGAELFGMSLADFALLTSANFDRLFARAVVPATVS
jgi:TatD DNase family protein